MISAFIDQATEWMKDHKAITGLAVTLSFFTFLASLIVTPAIVIRMSPDYFLRPRARPHTFRQQHPTLRWTGLVLKNFLGFFLILAGIAMLALPGQGLLTIFMGLVLANFPGKNRLELYLVRLPAIAKSINWMRKKAGREPLQIPPKESGIPSAHCSGS